MTNWWIYHWIPKPLDLQTRNFEYIPFLTDRLIKVGLFERNQIGLMYFQKWDLKIMILQKI